MQNNHNEITKDDLWRMYKNREITPKEYIELSELRIKANKNKQ